MECFNFHHSTQIAVGRKRLEPLAKKPAAPAEEEYDGDERSLDDSVQIIIRYQTDPPRRRRKVFSAFQVGKR